jgi:carbon storage regulator
MLVVSRKNQQGIQIGEDIIIRIVKTGANRVQIGVEAPGEIRVKRLELLEPSANEDIESATVGEVTELLECRAVIPTCAGLTHRPR